MNTIKPSPRELAGLPSPFRRGKRNSDSMPFHCGDLVYDIADERHVGEVRAISSSVYITVRWLDTGWRSVVHADKLRKVTL